MSTSIDRFFAVADLAHNLWAMQSNLRENVQILQKGHQHGTLAVPITQAVQDAGKAFRQRLDLNDAAFAKDPDLVKQATTMGIDPTDLITLHATLKTQADILEATAVSDTAGLDKLVADVLAAVPETERAFPTPVAAAPAESAPVKP